MKKTRSRKSQDTVPLKGGGPRLRLSILRYIVIYVQLYNCMAMEHTKQINNKLSKKNNIFVSIQQV
jgi:hypothetical protein